MKSSVYLAPAKINLCLHVEGKRADGYHELRMIMQKVDLCDELEVTVVPDGGVQLYCDSIDAGPAEANLVTRAAHAILAFDPQQRGVSISLKKNIPIAAGLGGGSSDAATTLMALNDLLGLQLSDDVLHREALALGADVPFFLQGPVSWACGIGDQLQPVVIEPPLWIVLVNPRQAVSTGQVYGAIGEQGYSSCALTERLSSEQDVIALLHNDLESPALAICPQIAEAKEALKAAGSQGVLMSGSGATVFGLFFDEAGAESALRQLKEHGDWWSALVRPLQK